MLQQVETNKSWMSWTDPGEILKVEMSTGKAAVVCYYKLCCISAELFGTSGWFGGPLRFSVLLNCFGTTGLKMETS